jgi:hypothetical protein
MAYHDALVEVEREHERAPTRRVGKRLPRTLCRSSRILQSKYCNRSGFRNNHLFGRAKELVASTSRLFWCDNGRNNIDTCLNSNIFRPHLLKSTRVYYRAFFQRPEGLVGVVYLFRVDAKNCLSSMYAS